MSSPVMSHTDLTAQAAEFAALHRRGQPFVLPNAWDVASALLLAEAGFPAVGTTSLGVTAAAGLIDGTGTGRAYTLALAAAIVPRLQVPETVDLEGGYSDEPSAVAELAAELASLGAAGINLEDAGAGGGLRPPRVQADIVRAVVAAAPALFVNARTDTYWLQVGPPQGRLEETIRRLTAYADAGASGVFVPALWDTRALAAVTGGVGLPLNVLWRPGLDMEQLAAAGVARVSTGSAPYRRALAAGLATAIAARDGAEPPGPDVAYRRLIGLLESSQAGVRSAGEPAGEPAQEPVAQSTPLSRA
jgi:2-methylisocitrate lyase-like PEP mutase family enzyme